MSAKEEDVVVIVGAGLAGALMAVYLAKRGFKVRCHEMRSDMRRTDISAGRSINLALSTRGMRALKEVGILDEVMKTAVPMTGRMLHAVDGELTYVPYSRDGKSAIYSVSRGELNCKLMTLAEQHGVEIVFESKMASFDRKTGVVAFQSARERSATPSAVKPITVLGADGAYSGVRWSMMKMDRFSFSQSYLEHGYKELCIPPLDGAQSRLKDVNALHIWPRGAYMMIALPNADMSWTVTLFLPFEAPAGEACFDALRTDDDVLDFFKRHMPDAIPLMPTLLDDFKANATASLATMRCWPWSVPGGRSTLLGDAAHAVVPFFGQGMNASFEDCYVLNACLESEAAGAGSARDVPWASVYTRYERERKANADAIADMAIENFVEMRDLTADPVFQFRKQVAHRLGNDFPEHFRTRYEHVSFSNIPYAEAVRLGRLNDKVLDELCGELCARGDFDIGKVDFSRARALIEEHLPKPKL